MEAIEALTNIAANLGEICGVWSGTALTLTCWIPLVVRCPGYSKNMLLTGVALLIGGLLTPPITYFIAKVSPWLALLVAWAMAIPIVYFGVRGYYLPSRIAWGRAYLGLIGALNTAFFIPGAWIVALALALKLSKKKAELFESEGSDPADRVNRSEP